LKFGFSAPNYGDQSDAEILRESALAAERLGYDSVWVTDHILLPKDSGTPYERIFESVTTLAHLSGLTSKIRLGISSLVLPVRNPIIAAKQIATLDALSGGRMMLCVGAGWNEKEFGFMGSNFHDRGKRLDDGVALLSALWGGSDRFRGRALEQYYEDATMDPVPVQARIPFWVGGSSAAAMKRAALVGDAWHLDAYPLEEFRPLISRFRELSGAESKAITIRIAMSQKLDTTRVIDPHGIERIAFCSSKRENGELLAGLEKLGVTYVIVAPGAAPGASGELFESQDAVLEGQAIFAEQFL
jgi:probable F420-dependent oxidoreductase